MNDFLELTQGLVETHDFEESSNFEPIMAGTYRVQVSNVEKKVEFPDYKPIGITSLYVDDSILLVKASDPKTSPFQIHAFSLKDFSDKGHFVAKGA